jgi:redox-sensitive bicupin YhaK (pirin superfamily)
MIAVRRSDERGHARHGWLESRHTFSFADYRDARFMGFRDLRVINEDRVAPGRGFGKHSHRDMEIVSWVIAGELAHEDSLGNGSVIRPGDLQRMSAGTGVTHSEQNPSPTAPVHFLQIWILPERDGLPASYEQRHFPAAERTGRLRLLASRDGRDGSVVVQQDVALYGALLAKGETVEHALAPGRHGWIQVVRGAITANGSALAAGDGAALSGEASVAITAGDDAELLLFDLS